MLIDEHDLKTIKKLNFKHPYVWLATWCGLGFCRPAPGTWGSIGAIPPALIIYALWTNLGMFLGILVLACIGFWAADRFGKATENSDSKMIVIDEVLGQWIALWPSLYFFGTNLFMIFLAFVLFRLFDIMKPWPVSYFDQRVKGALGVMGDDVIAGIMAAVVILGVHYAGLGL